MTFQKWNHAIVRFLFQELLRQIKLPVIKPNPVFKRSRIKRVERIEDSCCLRSGQLTIRCQALTRGLQCSLQCLIKFHNSQWNSNYLGCGIVHLICSLGDLGHLSIGNSDQLETDVLSPHPGGPAHSGHCNSFCCELSNQFFVYFLWMYLNRGDTWSAQGKLASIVDLGVRTV